MTRVLIMANLFILASHENKRRGAENNSGTFKIFLFSFGFGPKFLTSTKTHILNTSPRNTRGFGKNLQHPISTSASLYIGTIARVQIKNYAVLQYIVCILPTRTEPHYVKCVADRLTDSHRCLVSTVKVQQHVKRFIHSFSYLARMIR
jgi:hypothetical protein